MRQAVSIVIATLMIALPIATAAHGAWLAGSGSFEPNTVWDTEATKPTMFATPNRAAVERAYLNAIVMHNGAGVNVAHNPNFDGGSVMGVVANYAYAMLGFWRDCNADGYIGSSKGPHSALRFSQYPRAGESIDEAICPPGTPYNPTNPVTNSPDGMIDEFRWIGPDAGCDAWELGCPGNPTPIGKICVPPSNPNSPICPENPNGRPPTNGMNDVTDNRSRVWGDWNYPGGKHIPKQGLKPFPRGTMSDSDGTLKWVDDATGREISRAVGPAWTTKPNVGACDQPHPVFLGGPNSRLPVADRGTCGLWPLFQAYRLYNDSTCLNEDPSRGRPVGCAQPDPIVTTWDTNENGNQPNNPCDDFVRQDILLPTNGHVFVALPNPAVGVNPNFLADGSLVGTVNHQVIYTNASGFDETGQCGNPEPNTNPAGCSATFHLECDSQASDVIHLAPDHQFNWTNASARHELANFGFFSVEAMNGAVGSGGTYDGPGLASSKAGWYSTTVWSHRPPRLGWGHTVNAFLTVYADVTPQAFQRAGLGASPASALPGGADNRWTYGTEACPSITTGGANVNPANDWDCSRTQWEAARLERTGVAWDAVIGDKYDLRDVDCFDNTIAERVDVADTSLDLSDVKAGAANCAALHG